jgi:pimeloyl-ACP methyl ester carboxylesterase
MLHRGRGEKKKVRRTDVVAHLPHAKQVVIPQVGHLLHLTASATINRLIDEFLVDP